MSDPSAAKDRVLARLAELPTLAKVTTRPTTLADGRRRGTSPGAGEELDRFEDRGLMAVGGVGRIHRMYDRRIQRTVAVKRLADDEGRDLQYFLEEAQITGQLDHPNVVPVHEICADGAGRATAFAMKLVEGHTLTELLRGYSPESGPTDRELVSLLQIFLKVCDAVAFAHSRGVVHRDLKPDNIMVGGFGQVYVMDWGLAKLMAGEREEAEAPRVSLEASTRGESDDGLCGTLAYMADEQLRCEWEAIDERTDVFGLGGVLYEILTQQAPRPTREALFRPVAQPQLRVGSRVLPGRLCDVAMKALAARPEDRHQSVVELRDAVDGFVRGGGWFVRRIYPPGSCIVAEGDALIASAGGPTPARGAQEAYVIEAGSCEVWKRDGLGNERLLRVMEAGEIFGEMALFSARGQRTATVKARDRVVVTVISKEHLDREIGGRTWLRKLIETMARRFVETEEGSGQSAAAPREPPAAPA